jgi:acetylornithine deacetylase/succinyl-diaminopimelate desuccinylase-like protein
VTRQDKVYFNLDVVARGTATHSSKPMPDPAIVRLSRALDMLGGWQGRVTLTPVTRDYFGALAEASSNQRFARAVEMMLQAQSQEVLERYAALMVKASDYPYLHSALLRATHAFVIAKAGYKENVIPSSATCRINCRGIPDGQKPKEVYEAIKEWLADEQVEVRPGLAPGQSEEELWASLEERWATPPATLDTVLIEGLEAATATVYPGAVFSPALFEAGTSLGPWRQKGIPGYGVYPYVIDNDQLIGMHGNDERIATAALAKGTDFMYEVFARLVV